MNFPHHNPTFIIKTLGCKVNQYESEVMRQSLLRNGYNESGNPELADIYIINSCTVTHKADRDTRRLIRHFHKVNPKAKTIVCGCYAELKEDREALSQIPGVTWLVRNREKDSISEILMSMIKMQDTRYKQITNYKSQITSFKDRDRAFVKIQDGCSHSCSYCKVVLVRGPSVSRSEEEILNEIGQLIQSGHKEIVLTGVCLGGWGRDFKRRLTLDYLLKKICDLKENFRLRISSIEPIYVTSELVNAVWELPKICKHFHIPLQSGDDKILKAMNRPYNAKQFSTLLKMIKKKLPNSAFTTDVIVGFPGEDENSFRKTYRFLKRIKPSRMHIFAYSKRIGTRASGFGEIPDAGKVKPRKEILKHLAHSLTIQYDMRFKNKIIHVVVESQRDKTTQLLTGYTDTYIKVLLDGPDSLLNCLIAARILKVSGNGIFAKPLNLDKGLSI